ncbi:MAG: transcription antitermination factor NusB [Desulfurobacterium sp.]|nr:MAG: transcription antitermination factor NusB [Desulfurobacterium sp.]
MTNREKKEAREHACLMMYQYDVGNFSPDEVVSNYWEERSASPQVKQMAELLFKRTLENLKKVDMEISRYLKKGWVVSRLLPMDRSILRVATYEILNENFSPPEAVINDAVDIAKVYGEDVKSPKFVNAILDRVKSESGK